MQIQISWLLRSQLIWIYTVCKGSVHLDSAGQGLKYPEIFFLELSEEFHRDSKNEFESAAINEPSVFESLKFSWSSGWSFTITKTYQYNFDPLKPHFYIVKLGFSGVYIILLFLLKNIDCGYSLEQPRRGGTNEYPQSMFWAEIWKISEFLSENFHFFWWWNFQYIWIGVFS